MKKKSIISSIHLTYGTYGDDNREIIYDLLRNLNDSDLLRDLVPNTVYNLFIGDPIFSITGGSEPVDFTRVDPFYHYFYDPSTLTKRVDYDAKYSNADISGLNSILADYQNFDQIAGSANWNNKATLLNIIGTDDYIMTSAVRDYAYVQKDAIRFEYTNPEALYAYTEEELQILMDEMNN